MIVRTLLSFTTALSLAACSNAASSANPQAKACSFAFSGNRTEAASVIASCGLLSVNADADDPDAGDGGVDAGDAAVSDAAADDAATGDAATARDYYLIFRASSARIRAFTSTFDLGPSPSAGQFSPESVSSWSATGTNDDGCTYLAGTDAVPSGNFMLTLSAVDSVAGQPTQAHGTLTLDSSVKAPPQTDCGSGDIEAVTVQF